MRDVKGINRTELNEILKEHYGYNSVSIRRIWCGRGSNDLSVIDLGPDGILDMLLDVGDGKEDKNEIDVGYGKEDKNERRENCWKYKVEFLIPNRVINMSPRAILIREKEGCVTWLEPCEK